MDEPELVEALLALSEEVGLEVRILRGQNPAELDFTPSSSSCRVMGKFWVVLSPNDPAKLHIRVLCEALKSEAATALEERYLPPAIRDALEADS
ncbi:MAG: hypothetical protein ACI8W3_002616 [Myxococcota bacterium]|jgi:hypothetical protein